MKIINAIKHITKIFKKIIPFLKEVKKLPNVWSYILLSLFLTVIFFIFTFPYSSLIRNQLQSLGENIGKSANIGEIDFNLLTDSKIESMTITFKDGAELTLTDVDFNIGIISFLIGNTISGDIQIKNLKYEKEKEKITVSGRSDFDLKFNSMSEFPANGRIKLDLKNITANGLIIKEFDIPPVRFSSITADINIAKKKISIDEFKAAGPDIKGSINGSVIVAQFFNQSQLNLNIIIDSSSPFIENYKILLSKWIDNSNKIQLAVKGSISNPRIDSAEEKNTGTIPEPRTNIPEQRNRRLPADSFPKPRMEQRTEPRKVDRGERGTEQQPQADQPQTSFPGVEPPVQEDNASE
ncbi:MAG: type II secretion system protein GspN [Spirochaetota bacterium]